MKTSVSFVSSGRLNIPGRGCGKREDRESGACLTHLRDSEVASPAGSEGPRQRVGENEAREVMGESDTVGVGLWPLR